MPFTQYSQVENLKPSIEIISIIALFKILKGSMNIIYLNQLQFTMLPF